MDVFAWNQFSMLLATICCDFDPNSLQDKDALNIIAEGEKVGSQNQDMFG